MRKEITMEEEATCKCGGRSWVIYSERLECDKCGWRYPYQSNIAICINEQTLPARQKAAKIP